MPESDAGNVSPIQHHQSQPRSSYLDKVLTLSTDGGVKVERLDVQLDVVASFQCDDVDTVHVVRVRVVILRGDNLSSSVRERPPAFC